MLLRDRDDSAHAALERMIPAMTAARERAYETRRFRVLRHDDAMGAALATTPGAIGVFGLGAATGGQLPLKVLSIDGQHPSVEAVEAGRWQATRDLALVARPDRLARANAFVSFATGPKGVAIIRREGYVPRAVSP